MKINESEADALAVLGQVKAALGRNYKSAIRLAWMDGNYDRQNLEDWSSQLQRMRNQFGPSWLVKAKPITNEQPQQRVCYALLPSEMANPRATRVTPIIVKEGESGFYKTDWQWIKAHAEEALQNKNAGLGITPAQADEMFTKSLFNSWTDAERQAAALNASKKN